MKRSVRRDALNAKDKNGWKEGTKPHIAIFSQKKGKTNKQIIIKEI